MSRLQHTLTLDLGERSYPIYIGQGLLDSSPLAGHIPSRQVLIVTNDVVAPLYLERVKAQLAGFQLAECILPDGEEHKTLDTLNLIFDRLLTERFDRGCTLLALGGGVVGDITGFAAASYQRGVHFIQVPTTLLSQVDSSVGGKTGVNHPLGKNMIGAFYQPRAVLIDTDSLKTLDDRQLSAGLAEVIKYGLIDDPEFFDWLEIHLPRLLAREPEALAFAIERSCADKARIVASDERESGRRALLNLGHTFGHAIETGMGYGQWLHGEAVAAGICMAADLSQRMTWLDEPAQARIQALMAAARLPTWAPEDMSPEQFKALMAVDKKVLAGQLRLVLLKGIGQAQVTADFSAEALDSSLRSAA
jgi:3-dehydroquinate synthase